MLAENTAPKPQVRVAEADYERLWDLAGDSSAPGATLLRQELERATVVSDGHPPLPFIRLHSKVEFADLLSGRVRKVTLVEPHAADIDEDRLSVLAPAGAALIGLSPGDTFSWTVDGGRPRVLVVNRVTEGS
jgi:regulator of nucleoside diphosphate kinase